MTAQEKIANLSKENERLRQALWRAQRDFNSLIGRASYDRTLSDVSGMANAIADVLGVTP